MEDGSVTAEANDQIGISQLPIQSGKMDIPGQLTAVIHLKWKTDLHLEARFLQNLHGVSEGVEVFIPVWIGG